MRAVLPVRVHDLECLADCLPVLGGHHVHCHVHCHAHVHVHEWPHSDQHFHIDCHRDLDPDCQYVHAIGR
jgi:hypothetical protein